MFRNVTVSFLLLFSSAVAAQSYKVYGKITNTKLEPLAFVSVEVKEIKTGTITKEDGSYELQLEEGKYDLVVSMIGYQSQVITIIVGRSTYQKNIILEIEAPDNLSEVIVKGKFKDPS